MWTENRVKIERRGFQRTLALYKGQKLYYMHSEVPFCSPMCCSALTQIQREQKQMMLNKNGHAQTADEHRPQQDSVGKAQSTPLFARRAR
jgi:hypothetical protein